MASRPGSLPGLGASISARRRALFVAGAVLAVGAFALTLLVGSSLLVRSQAAGADINVVVAARDIKPREALTGDAVKVVAYPSSLAPAGAFATLAQAGSRFATVAIAKGTPLSSGLTASSPELVAGSGDTYLPIPQGFVAFTVPANEQEAVAGYIAPGDYIDVMATLSTQVFNPKDTQPRLVTKTIFQNVHVIRVGPSNAAKNGAAVGVASSLTVAIAPCDAEMFTWLMGNGSMKYVLRSYKDYAPANTTPAACPATGGIAAAQVDGRFGFTKV